MSLPALNLCLFHCLTSGLTKARANLLVLMFHRPPAPQWTRCRQGATVDTGVQAGRASAGAGVTLGVSWDQWSVRWAQALTQFKGKATCGDPPGARALPRASCS